MLLQEGVFVRAGEGLRALAVGARGDGVADGGHGGLWLEWLDVGFWGGMSIVMSVSVDGPGFGSDG